ncbi:MAG: hypothetical protein MR654_05345 [Corynebacterium glucuronolyticum]|nr:hypothetical protein [Corynebacterium glucuronolyticum]
MACRTSATRALFPRPDPQALHVLRNVLTGQVTFTSEIHHRILRRNPLVYVVGEQVSDGIGNDVRG